MELTVLELSKSLGVAPKTVERWLKQGNLPVVPQGNRCRFDKTELTKWAAKNNIIINFSDKKQVSKNTQLEIPLSVAVQNGGVFHHVSGDSVHKVLQNSIEKFSIIPEDSKDELLDRLVERENALSTGIGKGIAIPHPREQLDYLTGPVICISFLDQPVDYNALDNKPVFVLFFILCPDLKMHLHLLSSLSFCLRDTAFNQFLNTQPQAVDLISKIESLQQSR